MKKIWMIGQLGLLFGFYWLGVTIQNILMLPIPGSILGMILLFCLLHVKWFRKEWIEGGSKFLVKHLALLFIPATVGLMDYLSLFKGNGIITIFIVLFSTGLVMVSTALISNWLTGKSDKKQIDCEREKEGA
ncbi:CidA/LrgA family protein [Metabacillus arenae]|uniref:CidA/LrgA family protein n=1 Tax=Metabacillus arenae TaxID=2771434 RepID=A0A926NLF2_9BACI|nr:CidA/LrgA family protein [Metabacillus arenae]MBD1380187.1 CidA/LrgA family protein [Metabacillus arenae]